MKTILIIDDEQGIRKTLGLILGDEGYRALSAEDALVGMETLEKERVSLVFLDVLLPKMGGLEALEKIRGKWPGIEVVVISGHANVDMAVRAVKMGAFDFLEKPLSLDKVLLVCRNAFSMQELREENRTLKQTSAEDAIVGASRGILEVKALIQQAGSSDARILITGENGTGKELVARAVHRGSARADRAFVEVNCAAIPDTLIESELFGHEKGAFTGAVASRKGRFEMAHRGTLFLDEIGDMSLTAQAKVLRAIQEQKIEPLGGEKSVDADARVISATNKDLEKECELGRFRQDLFFRLNVIPIRIPPLRERTDDIQAILFHFLRKTDSEKAAALVFDDAALETLMAYGWPGNVRELKNLAERILVMQDGNHITASVITTLLQKFPDSRPEPPSTPAGNGLTPGHPPQSGAQKAALAGQMAQSALDMPDYMNLAYNEAKDAFEKRYLAYNFAKNNGVIAKTAEAIGMYPGNLHAKLRKHQITERK
jgi:two-component system nitrogen regulation response regulator NtrX